MLTITIDKSQPFYVIPADLRNWWPYVRGFILSAEALVEQETEESIVGKLLEGKYHLFVVLEDDLPVGACTVHLLKTLKETVGVVRHIGGNFPALIAHEDYLIDWLKAMGATKISISGRRGWARRLPPKGYEEKFVTMEKDIA